MVIIITLMMNCCHAAPMYSWSENENAQISRIRNLVNDLSDQKMAKCFPSSKSIGENDFPPITLTQGYLNISYRIGSMFDLDQNARLMDQMAGYAENSFANAVARKVDADNLIEIKNIYHIYGIPHSSQVGVDVLQKFITLIIHADKDRNFQLSVLKEINNLPSTDKDKVSLKGPLKILENRDGYKNKQTELIDIPYSKPVVMGQAKGNSCMKDIFDRWYPWYVQEHLPSVLLRKARSSVSLPRKGLN